LEEDRRSDLLALVVVGQLLISLAGINAIDHAPERGAAPHMGCDIDDDGGPCGCLIGA